MEEIENASKIKESNDDTENLDRDGHCKKTPFIEAKEMGEVTQKFNTTPNILKGDELKGTTEHADVDDAMGHSSESEYLDNMETHEEEMDNDNTIVKANDNKKRKEELEIKDTIVVVDGKRKNELENPKKKIVDTKDVEN